MYLVFNFQIKSVIGLFSFFFCAGVNLFYAINCYLIIAISEQICLSLGDNQLCLCDLPFLVGIF